MRSQIFFILLVGFVYASNNPGWKENNEYTYKVNGRSLVTIDESSEEYTGIVFKAYLKLQPRPDGKLYGVVQNPKYSPVRARLSGGWNFNISESNLSWKPLTLSKQPFQIEMTNGVITDLLVSNETSNWENNILKGIVSQFQLKTNQNPSPSGSPNSEVFITMEDTISGNTATLYEIRPLQDYVLQGRKDESKYLDLKGDGDVIEVIKYKNYSNYDELPSYFHGFGDIVSSVATNKMGNFVVRDTTSRAVLTGNLNQYDVQSSTTVNKIFISTNFNDKRMGSVISSLNVVLESIKPQKEKIDETPHPVRLGNLVYTYDSPQSSTVPVHRKGGLPKSYFRRSISRLRLLLSSTHYSAETEPYMLEKPSISRAPGSPFLPFTTGFAGKSIRKKIDLVKTVQELTVAIANDLFDSELFDHEKALDRTSTLINLIRLMDADELQMLSSQFYTNSEKGPKHAALNTFLDAVAGAGTGPALLCIKNLIENNKVKGQQISELITAMAASIREPTLEYMRTFYELIKEPQVMSTWPLNNTALLTYTHLLRRVYVDARFSKTHYPVNTFGDFLSGGEQLVKQEVIPYLTKQLNEALAENATSRIHAYICALGNIAVPEILTAFEACLEGRTQCSQFQRLAMVLSLEDLAQVHPENARSVLFKVYQNSAETPEVRIAAIYLLMSYAPTTEMLMAMASYTNVDPQERVNAAVKSSIESAAELEGEEFSNLRSSARAARPLLTKKSYGIEYGVNYLRSYLTEASKVSLEETAQLWGSADEFLPKGIRYTLFGDIIGLRRNINIQAHVSSIAELLHVGRKQFERYQRYGKLQKDNFEDQRQYPLSSQNINGLFNIKTAEREQLEGLLYSKFDAFYGMFSFDNYTIYRIPEAVRQWEAKLREGVTINKLKLFNSQKKTLSFPTELGMPFIFTYDAPTIFKAQGNLDAVSSPELSQDGAIHIPERIQVNSNINITFSTKAQSRLTITTPFDNQQYIAGFDKHFEVRVPLRSKVDIDVEGGSIQAEIEPRNTEKKHIFHYKAWPYITKSDIKNFDPISSQKKTLIIKRDILPKIVTTFGKEMTGMVFQVELEHERQQVDLLTISRLFSGNNFPSGLWGYNDIQYVHICVSNLPQQSSTHKAILRVSYQGEYNSEDEPDSSIRWKFEENEEPSRRQQKIMSSVSRGIENVFTQFIDASVDFQGKNKITYALIGALAKSNVDPKSRAIIFFKRNSDNKNSKPYEVHFLSKSNISNNYGLDVNVALGNEPISDTEMELTFGSFQETFSKVDMNLKYRRTEERKQYLKQLPTFHQCKEEMCDGNKQLSACQNMMTIVNFMDSVSFDVRYENLKTEIEEAFRTVYQAIRFNYLPSLHVSSGNSTLKANEVKMQARFHPDLKFVDVSVQTRDQESNFSNIWVHPFVKKTVDSHPVYSLRSHWLPNMFSSRGSCFVDQTTINTFSNLTYPADISKHWTTVLQYIPKIARQHGEQNIEQQLRSQIDNYVVLVRESSESSTDKDMKITLSSDRTVFRTMSIDLRPGRKEDAYKRKSRVIINGQEIKISSQQSYPVDNVLVISTLPYGIVFIDIYDAFYILYDGQRAKITVTNYKFKDFIIGLCGHFNGQRDEDFITPGNCIARDYRKFIKSYEVENQEGQEIRREFAQNTTQCVQKQAPLYVDVISDRDANRTISHSDPGTGACTYFQTKYIQQNGEICFTIRPLPACSGHCQPNGSIIKNVQVHCLQRSERTDFWMTQIDQGSSVDFSNKEAHKSLSMPVPQICSE